MEEDLKWPPRALAIFSGRIILNFGVQKRLRAFLYPFFTGGGNPFRLAASRQATFPKGTALVVAGSFAAAPKGAPLGELSRSD